MVVAGVIYTKYKLAAPILSTKGQYPELQWYLMLRHNLKEVVFMHAHENSKNGYIFSFSHLVKSSQD